MADFVACASACWAGGFAGRLGREITIMTSAPTTAAPSTQVEARQPIAEPIAVVSGEPTTIDRVDPNDTAATALPICPGGAIRAATGLTSDQNNPWVNAAVTRPATSVA